MTADAATTAWKELVARYPTEHPEMPVVDWNAIRTGYNAGWAAAETHLRAEIAAQALEDAAAVLASPVHTPDQGSADLEYAAKFMRDRARGFRARAADLRDEP